MEIFGLITAILAGAVLAIYRERTFQEKLKLFQSSQNELVQLNNRLSGVIQPKVQLHDDLKIEAERLKKELNMLATNKFIGAYVRENDSEVYEQPSFLTITPYSSERHGSVSSQQDKNDCYIGTNFPQRQELYA